MRVAAIDIGTVTSRLFIADVDARGVHEVVRQSVITNLGEGVDATGMLAPEAIERTVAQVAEYKGIIDACASDVAVDRVVALATSASRDAGNADVFVGALEQLGVTLSVIAGSREAELSFLGAANDFRNENVLFSDIGGGSTELVCGRAQADGSVLVPDVFIQKTHSFNVGCRRMTERFLASNPPSAQEVARAKDWARSELAPFFEADVRFERLVSVAGTPTSVVAVRDELVPYDREKVHKAVVAKDDFKDIMQHMLAMPLEERMKVPGLQPQRAGVFPAGLIITDALLDLAGLDSFTACESDILKGIVLDCARGL